MVRAPVGQLAARVFIPPAELVVATRPAFGLAVVAGQIAKVSLGHGTEPAVPVEVLRGLGDGNVGAAWGAVDAAGRALEFADASGLKQRDRFDEPLVAALLGADLDDPSRLAAGLADQLAFGDRQRHRLFTVDVFACEHRFDGDFGVPVIGSGDVHDIDFWVVEDSAVVGRLSRFNSAPFFDKRGGSFHALAVDVADRDVVAELAKAGRGSMWAVDAGRFLAPATAGADRGDARAIVGGDESGGAGLAVKPEAAFIKYSTPLETPSLS